MEDIPSWKLIGVILVSLIFALLFLFLAIKTAQFDREEKDWPAIKEKILYAELGKGPTPDRGANVRASGYSWWFKVKYEFHLAGEIYTSTRLTNKSEIAMFNQNDGDASAEAPERLRNFRDRYVQGELVDVYVSPEKPNFAFLVLDKTKSQFVFFLCAAGLFSLISVIVMAVFLKRF